MSAKEMPISGMKTRPYGMPLMFDAWLSCVLATVDQVGAVKAFESETGCTLGKTPLDRMIDAATGNDQRVLAEWCDWVTRNVWGEEQEAA